MFSYDRVKGSNPPTLSQSKDYWSFQNGARIIEFLTTLDRITPSLDYEEQFLPGSQLGHCPQDRFMDDGNENLFDFDFMRENGPLRERLSQGIPHEYAAAFVTSVFRPEFENCNFLQALTAMDYLTSIEINRKQKLYEAAIKLGITKNTWSTVLAGEVDAWHWVGKVQEEEFIIDGYYAKIFINLRIWIMVAELQQLNFDKMNVFALLNTLFPPSVTQICSEKLTPQVMYKYRAALYRYVLDVGEDGPRAVDPFISRHLRPGTGCSWYETRYQLEKYLELALNMTRQAQDIYGIHSFHPTPVNHSRTSSSRGTSISSGRLRANSSAHASFDSTLSPSDVPTTPGSTIYDGASARSQLRCQPRTKAESGHYESPTCDPQSNTSTSPYPPSVLMPRENRSRRKPSGTRFPVRVSTNTETASSITLTQDLRHHGIERYDKGNGKPIPRTVDSETTEHATRPATPSLETCNPTARETSGNTGSLGKPSSISENAGRGMSSESQNFMAHKNRTGTGSRFLVAVPPINTALCNTGRYRKYLNATSSESPGSSVQHIPPGIAAFMGAAVSTVLDRRIQSQMSNQKLLDQTLQRSQSSQDKDSAESPVPRSASPVKTVMPGQARLPSDNMAFLQKPYDSTQITQADPVVKKKASITNLYMRSSAAVRSLKKKASSNSLKTNASLSSTVDEHPTSSDLMRPKTQNSGVSKEPGTMVSPINTLSGPEPFPRYSRESSRTASPIVSNQTSFDNREESLATPFHTLIGKSVQVEVPKNCANISEKSSLDIVPCEAFPGEQKLSKKRQTLKKAKSFVVEKSLMGKDTEGNEKFPHSTILGVSSHAATSLSSTVVRTGFNQRLKQKASLSSIFARSQNSEIESLIHPPLYFASNESQESVLTARPSTRTAKSFSSLRTIKSQRTLIKESSLTSSQTPMNLTSAKGDVGLISNDLNKIHPDESKRAFNPPDIFSMLGIYQHSLDFQQKEYSRRWLIEDSKSRRNPDLNPPVGRPLEFMESTRTAYAKGVATETRGKEEVDGGVPRATRKPFPRPERFRVDSIFPLRSTQRKKRLRFKEIDTSKWEM